jgi:anaerobic selenocysteine-containing dehydrogenase
MDIHPQTAAKHGIEDGDWVFVETPQGVIRQRARVADEIDPRVINVRATGGIRSCRTGNHGWAASGNPTATC